MTMTDDELNRDWVPNGRRPQSTIARSFSQELVDIFRIENSVADLNEKIDRRKQVISTQTDELEAIEARIREMEERLRRSKGQADPAAGAVDNTAADAAAAQSNSKDEKQLPSRPERGGAATAAQAASGTGGQMPPTPSASEGEYELVGKAGLEGWPPTGTTGSWST